MSIRGLIIERKALHKLECTYIINLLTIIAVGFVNYIDAQKQSKKTQYHNYKENLYQERYSLCFRELLFATYSIFHILQSFKLFNYIS